MVLKRYEMGRYTFGVPIESPTGSWVRYSDYYEQGKVVIHQHTNLIKSLNREKALQIYILELEAKIEKGLTKD